MLIGCLGMTLLLLELRIHWLSIQNELITVPIRQGADIIEKEMTYVNSLNIMKKRVSLSKNKKKIEKEDTNF